MKSSGRTKCPSSQLSQYYFLKWDILPLVQGCKSLLVQDLLGDVLGVEESICSNLFSWSIPLELAPKMFSTGVSRQEKKIEPYTQDSMIWLLETDYTAAAISSEHPVVWELWKICWCRAWWLSNNNYPQLGCILWYLVQIRQDLPPEHGFYWLLLLFSLSWSIVGTSCIHSVAQGAVLVPSCEVQLSSLRQVWLSMCLECGNMVPVL